VLKQEVFLIIINEKFFKILLSPEIKHFKKSDKAFKTLIQDADILKKDLSGSLDKNIGTL